MPAKPRHARRQVPPPAAPTTDGVSGIIQQTALDPVTSALILASTASPHGVPTAAPTPPAELPPAPIDPSSLSPSSSIPVSQPSGDSAAVKASTISLSTVVGACVGTFIGLALVILLFIWWMRHTTPKPRSRSMPRSPMAENRQSRAEMGHVRQQSSWNKLDDDLPTMPPITRQMTQEEVDEKNFSMFKKRSNSTRTTKTTKALEEHGFDMPPLELSKYHPHLAEELALQSPDKPFAQRQDSGMSWERETVGDDSFLSLRSVRIESGTMSPTLSVVKMTPVAQSSQLHHWESAEVIAMDEPSSSNQPASFDLSDPFADQPVHRPLERRKSNSNPFFGAGETPVRRRSRSNSRSRRSLSRERSRSHAHNTVARDTMLSHTSGVNPFDDIAATVDVALPSPAEREFSRHSHNDSIASGASGSAFTPSHHVMESLIAALDLSKVEAEKRLQVTPQPPPTASRHTSALYGEEADIASVSDYPPTPITPHAR